MKVKTLPDSDVPVFIELSNGKKVLARRLYGIEAFEEAFTNEIVGAHKIVDWDYAVPAGDMLT